MISTYNLYSEYHPSVAGPSFTRRLNVQTIGIKFNKDIHGPDRNVGQSRHNTNLSARRSAVAYAFHLPIQMWISPTVCLSNLIAIILSGEIPPEQMHAMDCMYFLTSFCTTVSEVDGNSNGDSRDSTSRRSWNQFTTVLLNKPAPCLFKVLLQRFTVISSRWVCRRRDFA